MSDRGGDAVKDGPLVLEVGQRRFELDALAQLNRMNMLGLVLPNVAHEVNNALQVVSGLVEMVSSRPELPRDVADKLTRMGAQAGRASSLIRELVAFARRDQAGVVMVDVRRVVEAALAMRRYHLARDRVAVKVVLPEQACLARLDGHYLQQVLINIIANAEEALKGKEDRALTLSASSDDTEVLVVVEDNAGGLTGDAALRAGEPFFSTNSGQALGLGLAVSRALVERQGGTLTLVPTAGGTQVRITLPVSGAPQ
jgi:C4-dicarboxylate-specific signal transduction histidine kinase